MSFYELIVRDKKRITNYANVKNALVDMDQRIETGRKATSPEERRKNIDTIKGLIGNFFIEDSTQKIYGNHAITDIEAIIRRSEFELADYELKQGLLSLSNNREISSQTITKVINTICAIANNGPNRIGKLIIGVTDKNSDAVKIKNLDAIEPRVVGNRFIVGVTREAKILKISAEGYFSKWKNAIRNSELSQPLKNSVMSNIDYHSFYGLGVIVITIQPQKELSYVGEDAYWRVGDETKRASTAKEIATLLQRF
jgi:predicted HTH transcriptional regulator